MCYLCSVDDGGVPVGLVGVDIDDALDNFLDDVPGQQGTTWTIDVPTTIDALNIFIDQWYGTLESEEIQRKAEIHRIILSVCYGFQRSASYIQGVP